MVWLVISDLAGWLAGETTTSYLLFRPPLKGVVKENERKIYLETKKKEKIQLRVVDGGGAKHRNENLCSYTIRLSRYPRGLCVC